MKFSIVIAGLIASLFTAAPAQAATQSFNLQLVSLCEGAAVCEEPGVDFGYLQSIYSQIDVVVNVLSTVIDNTLILERDSSGNIIPSQTNVNGQLIGGALLQFTQSFVQTSAAGSFFDIDANTIYMGITGDLLSPTLGVAFVDAPVVPFGIVENTAALIGGSAAAERFTTAVLAHEIGHVLGGEHEDAVLVTDLLQASVNQSFFTNETYLPTFSTVNANQIIDSDLLFLTPVQAVPLPASFPVLFGGFALLAGLRARRTSRA
ncbi:MAG: hypothetical protein ABJL99_24445 [Aliishimia sp.]